MNKPKLTIIIPTLHSRSELLLDLIEQLRAQPRWNECELLIAADAGVELLGNKRQHMTQMAQGEYICHFDDDDEPADNYIPAILEAIDSNPGVDAIAFRGRCTTGPDRTPVDFDYRLDGKEGEWLDGCLWRTPNHLTPVRAELAKSVAYQPMLVRGEDLAWGRDLAPLLTSIARAGAAGEVLYKYRLDGTKDTPRVRAAQIAAHKDHRAIFTPQYKVRSGPGSTPPFSAPYREWLAEFIRDNQVRTIVDLGCGDLEVMSRVELGGARYRGVDVIKERVQANEAKHPHFRFEHRDIREWRFPRTDLVLCKDVVQHWSTPEVQDFLAHLDDCAHLFKFALITNCNYGQTVNTDIATGGWRAIDLTAPPFERGSVVFQWGTPNKDVVLIRGRRR